MAKKEEGSAGASSDAMTAGNTATGYSSTNSAPPLSTAALALFGVGRASTASGASSNSGVQAGPSKGFLQSIQRVLIRGLPALEKPPP
jgi:hypothetical protein